MKYRARINGSWCGDLFESVSNAAAFVASRYGISEFDLEPEPRLDPGEPCSWEVYKGDSDSFLGYVVEE